MTASPEEMAADLHAAVQDAQPGLAAVNELCSTCVGLFGVDGVAVSTVHDGSPQWTFGSSDEFSRRLDEHQFTFGEGPCIDTVATRQAVLVSDLASPHERRWPAFSEAALADGVRGVFALPILVAAQPVGALDMFRAQPGPLPGNVLAGAALAAELAARSLLDILAPALSRHDDDQDGDAGDDDRRQRGDHGDVMDLKRVEIYQATGMLIDQLDVAPAHAVARLRAHAMATGQTASQVAFAIIERRLRLERDDRRGDDDRGNGWGRP